MSMENAYLSEATSQSIRAGRLEAALKKAEEERKKNSAGVKAVYAALTEALRAVDPDNPLLQKGRLGQVYDEGRKGQG